MGLNEPLEKESVHLFYTRYNKSFSNTRINTWPYIKYYYDTYLLKGSLIYDCGCGNGRNTLQFKESIIINGDYNIDFLRGIKKPNSNNFRVDITQDLFKSKIFDNILCIAVLHHILDKSRRISALKNMREILSGTLLLSTWSLSIKNSRRCELYKDRIYNFGWGGDLSVKRYYYLYTKEELMSELIDVGFTIIEYKEEKDNHYFIVK